MNISKSLIQTSKFLRVRTLVNTSSKLFASKKKDGATQSDVEVDKSKKTVKSSASPSASATETTTTESAAPAVGNVKVIESIPGHKVKKTKLINLII